ncbi:MAG: hypothetical protein Q9228_005610, partial [Teloschistes exilis]
MAFTCFLKFPLEIRQHVYRSYFSNLDLSVSFSVSPLLLCSRKMHEEAQQLFWQNGRFTFRSTKTMVGFLTEIDHDTLINVRHIAVRGDDEEACDDEEEATQIVATLSLTGQKVATQEVAPQEVAPQEVAPQEVAPQEVAPQEEVTQEEVTQEEVTQEE